MNTDLKNKKIRIALFATDDTTWILPTCHKTVEALQGDYEIAGVYLFPDKLGPYTGLQIPLWYLKTFGPLTVLKLATFAAKANLDNPIKSWQTLSQRHTVPILQGTTPNTPEVYQWVTENHVDIILLLVGHILKGDILSAPKLGIINKHAGMLPSCRGLLPYIRARQFQHPVGVSFHKVDSGIDTGALLVQQPYTGPSSASMLIFYKNVFSQYPAMAKLAIENLLQQKILQTNDNLRDSYYSLPRRSDIKQFQQQGGCIAKWADIL